VDHIHELINDITKKRASSIAISFVNGSLSESAFNSVCARFASKMEHANYKAYGVMNEGYRRLSQIAYHVETKKEAFELIGQAFGSVDFFFDALEEQRLALKSYAQSIMKQDIQSWFKGMFLLTISAQGKEWIRKFRLEYITTLEPCTYDQIESGTDTV